MTTSLRDRLLALADKAIWAAAAGNATDLQPDDVRMLREAAEALTAPASPPALEGVDLLRPTPMRATSYGTQEPEYRMDAYWYGFSPTGLDIIDTILSAVASAGKGYHSTEQWNEDSDPRHDRLRGTTPVAHIQNAANDAAAAIRAASPAAPAQPEGGAVAWTNIETAESEFLSNLAEKGGLAPEVAGMLRHCSRLIGNLTRPAPAQPEGGEVDHEGDGDALMRVYDGLMATWEGLGRGRTEGTHNADLYEWAQTVYYAARRRPRDTRPVAAQQAVDDELIVRMAAWLRANSPSVAVLWSGTERLREFLEAAAQPPEAAKAAEGAK